MSSPSGHERRQELKRLLDVGGQIKDDADNEQIVVTLQRVTNVMEAANDLNDRTAINILENANEMVLDAQLLYLGHEIVEGASRKIGTETFSEEEYATAIKCKLGLLDGKVDWSKLTEISVGIAKTFIFPHSFFGTFKPEPEADKTTVVKERQKHQRSELAEKTAPTLVTQLQKEENNANQLSTIMTDINRIYKENDNKPIPYYKLIIDPNDFMNSVENAFQLSFLLRENLITIETQSMDKNLPYVRPLTKAEQQLAEKAETTKQAISTITPQLCQKLAEYYNITTPLLIVARTDET